MRAVAALLMIAWFFFGIVVIGSQIGKHRKPLTPDIALIGMAINLSLIVATYWLWQS